MRSFQMHRSALAAISVLALSACAGDGPTNNGGLPDATPPSATASVTASTGSDGYGTPEGFVFAPAGVSVLQNGTVTWSNSSGVDHNVTFSGVSNALANGAQYARTFPTAGNFSYACSIHPAMT